MGAGTCFYVWLYSVLLEDHYRACCPGCSMLEEAGLCSTARLTRGSIGFPVLHLLPSMTPSEVFTLLFFQEFKDQNAHLPGGGERGAGGRSDVSWLIFSERVLVWHLRFLGSGLWTWSVIHFL